MAALGACAAVAAFSTLWWPLGYDHAIFALVGAMVRAGGMPYRDAFETRGPLAFYLYAALEAVHGGSAVTVRAFDLVVLAAGVAMLWRVVAPVGGRRAAATAAALWTLYLVSTTYYNTAQLDLWASYAVLGAALVAARAGGARARDLVLAGGLVGACALTKPFYLSFLAVPWAAAAVTRGRRPADLARAALLLGAGCATPVAAMCAVLWATGAWGPFVAVHFGYNLAVYSSAFAPPPSLGARLHRLAEYGLRGPATVRFADLLPGAAAGLWTLWRTERGRPLAAALAAAVVVGTFCVLLQGKFFFYHWYPALVALAALVAVGLAGLLRGAAGGRAPSEAGPGAARLLALGNLVFLTALILAPALLSVRQWAAYLRGAKTADEYYAAFHDGWEIDPAEQRRAAEYVRARTRPGTPIAQWGVNAAVPYLAGRPIVGPFPVTRVFWIGPNAPVTQAYRQAYVREFMDARPPYVVRGRQAERAHDVLLAPLDSLLPPIADELARHYVLDRRMGDIEIYRRLDYTPSGAATPAVGLAR